MYGDSDKIFGTSLPEHVFPKKITPLKESAFFHHKKKVAIREIRFQV